ncbi:hypothetical protein [Roseinatronobacter monicus]|uniref:Uncharacterized protein n=1 Tax=Roseinatronobacter monicus TaxID=393481 RepID=A0A543KBJ0_9RHOB|nr:hypothetical protein [Roseinatronobacter monicus]TQM92412.1 hypothetical protein BD293_1017 [Roseinatronobacter monicus]
MNIARLVCVLERYPRSVQILVGITSILAAYSLFFIGFFSRTPFSHIIIMGAWSTSVVLLEVTTKLALSILSGRIVFYLIYGIIRSTNLVPYLINMIYRDFKKSRISQIYITRLLRKKTHAFSLIIGLLFFAIFAIENLHGVYFIVKTLIALMFTPALLYPLFFRPKHLLFPPPFIFLPQKPSGVSEDRWVVYAITCSSIIASSFFYFAGQSIFHARASKFQTVNTEHVSVVGSIIAANVSGVLFLGYFAVCVGGLVSVHLPVAQDVVR